MSLQEYFENNLRTRWATKLMSVNGKFIVDFNELEEEIKTEIINSPLTAITEIKGALEKILMEIGSISKEETKIRFINLSEEYPLRELTSSMMGKLIMVKGIVVSISQLTPICTEASWTCRNCGETTLNEQASSYLKPPLMCEAKFKNGRKCKGKAFRFNEEESKWCDYQELRIQERPEDLPSGQIPRWIHVELMDELIDVCRAGDIVSLIGILKPKPTSSSGKDRTVELVLEANNVIVHNKEIMEVNLTQEEVESIKKIATNPLCYEYIRDAIAPSIYGNEPIKEAIMYQLFGGVERIYPDIRIRGEINILLVGDPATAKSQLLRSVANLAPRAVYTSGKGSSAAGLTAAVIKRDNGFSLEVGALVIADKGIACIDEMDKMKEEDRVAIHEAMEQHTISIAKAGIVTRLNARTAVLGAANPAFGRYDQMQSIQDNINLPPTILSRFDLIFILKDIPDRAIDTDMASHILRLNEIKENDTLPQLTPELLKKYILYARRINPKITKEAKEAIREFYVNMREESFNKEGTISISRRQLESIIRVAEARARIMLKETCDSKDVEGAINIMREYLKRVGIDPQDGKQKIDFIESDVPRPQNKKDKLSTIKDILLANNGELDEEMLMSTAKCYGINNMETRELLGMLATRGEAYKPHDGMWRLLVT